MQVQHQPTWPKFFSDHISRRAAWLHWAEFFRTWFVFPHCWILTRNNDNYQFKRKKIQEVLAYYWLLSTSSYILKSPSLLCLGYNNFKTCEFGGGVYSFRFCILSWCKISKWNWILLVCMSTFNLFCKIEFFSTKKRKNVIKLDTTLNTHTLYHEGSI